MKEYRMKESVKGGNEYEKSDMRGSIEQNVEGNVGAVASTTSNLES